MSKNGLHKNNYWAYFKNNSCNEGLWGGRGKFYETITYIYISCSEFSETFLKSFYNVITSFLYVLSAKHRFQISSDYFHVKETC